MADLKNLSKAELAEQLEASLSRLADSEEKSEIQRLTHDLQTHQIELEMQNRELREAQLELEESRNRYADLYDFAPVGYLTLNNKGCITKINLTGAKMFGVERANIINQPMTRWLVAEYRQAFLKQINQVFKEKNKAVVELKIKGQADETIRNVQFESVLVQDNDNESLCHSAMVDISELKQYQAELIMAKEEAEAANHAKTQFLSRMSHEFRTPLNAILGFAQMLEMDKKEALKPEHKDMIEHILKGGWHLLDLINDLLDLTVIEANKLKFHLEDVDLVEGINESIEILQPLAAQQSISIKSTVKGCKGLFAHVDRMRFKQILLNLLSNAIKYNKPGGSVVISCEQVRDQTKRISITDSGIGISDAEISTLFEPFNRLYLRNYSVEGTGIGLTIAKQLVENMGGRIGVTSKEGQGSTFWIELPQEPLLPLAKAKAEIEISPTQIETAKATQAQYTMLYIEDNPSHLNLIENVVHDMPGIELFTANTALLGLELAHAHLPDIIVLDICLQGMDGFEVLEQLLANETTRNIPVIAVSASAMPRYIEMGLRAGFRRYLTKPINIAEFKKNIYEVLSDNVI